MLSTWSTRHRGGNACCWVVVLLTASVAAVADVAIAQQPSPASTAETIPISVLEGHLRALAADSMHRNGPEDKHGAALERADSATGSASPAGLAHGRLETGAGYVAEQFGKLGLQAGLQAGDPWFQEYPLPGGRVFDYDSTPLSIATFVRKGGVEVLAERGYEVRKEVRLSMATAAPLVRGAAAEGSNGLYLGVAIGPTRRPKPVIVAGPHTPATAAKIAVRDKVVFYVLPAELDTVRERQIVDMLARGSKGVVVVTDDSARFVTRQRSVRRPLPLVDVYMKTAKADSAWVVYVRPDSLAYLFTLAGLDLAALHRATAPIARESLPLSAWFWVRRGGVPPGTRPTGVNVVGMLEGSDSVLKRQYVVISAHLGPAGRRPVAGDSTGGRTTAAVEHEASGVAGLLAIARAFAETGTRPRRSVLFVATSGADQEFAGAEFVASAVVPQSARAPSRAVASLTLDLIGGHRGDSVIVDGLEEIDAGRPAAWLTANHADSGLTIVSGSIMRAPCADQCAFVRRQVPSLYFHDPTSRHDRTQSPPSASAVPDPAHTARVARLAFDFAQTIANAERSARWSAGTLEQLNEGRAGE